MGRIIYTVEIEAKNLLLDRNCLNCKHNDDWDHPHNGDTVEDCKINGPRRENM